MALAGLTAVLGLVIGSFLNVVVHRVPRGESVVHPPSACPMRYGDPAQGQRARPQLASPARAAVAPAPSPISKRYPLVELGTATLFG
jgi:leader peptidase (prepilin peptidase)/N-methyltransferase